MPKQKTLKVPTDFPAHLFKPLQRLKWDESGTLKNERELYEEFERRTKMLSDHFNFPREDQFYDQLGKKLLVTLVLPDQQRGPGRPLKGEVGRKERERLLKQVEDIEEGNKTLTDRGACKILRDDKRGEFHKRNIETLRSWLRRARAERWQKNSLLGALLRSGR